MPVVSYSSITTKSHRSSRKDYRSRTRKPTRLTPAPVWSEKAKQPPENLPGQKERLPASLQFLLHVQQASSVIAFSLIAAALGIYAWTVYAPKQWDRAYRHLETLLRYERHLTAANETLKNQLAQSAEKPGSGLAAPHPAQSIFLRPTSASPLKESQNQTGGASQPLMLNRPIAY